MPPDSSYDSVALGGPDGSAALYAGETTCKVDGAIVPCDEAVKFAIPGGSIIGIAFSIVFALALALVVFGLVRGRRRVPGVSLNEASPDIHADAARTFSAASAPVPARPPHIDAHPARKEFHRPKISMPSRSSTIQVHPTAIIPTAPRKDSSGSAGIRT